MTTDPKHDKGEHKPSHLVENPPTPPKPDPAKGDPSRAGDMKSINEPPGSQTQPPPVPPVVEVPEQHKGDDAKHDNKHKDR
jgi:hypothetical protein